DLIELSMNNTRTGPLTHETPLVDKSFEDFLRVLVVPIEYADAIPPPHAADPAGHPAAAAQHWLHPLATIPRASACVGNRQIAELQREPGARLASLRAGTGRPTAASGRFRAGKRD